MIEADIIRLMTDAEFLLSKLRWLGYLRENPRGAHDGVLERHVWERGK